MHLAGELAIAAGNRVMIQGRNEEKVHGLHVTAIHHAQHLCVIQPRLQDMLCQCGRGGPLRNTQRSRMKRLRVNLNYWRGITAVSMGGSTYRSCAMVSEGGGSESLTLSTNPS